MDKLAHVLAYGVITFLFIVSLRISHTLFPALVLLCGILLLAAIDELTQPLVNRTASFGDWLADVGGKVTVLVSSVYLKNSKRKSPTNENACQPNSDR